MRRVGGALTRFQRFGGIAVAVRPVKLGAEVTMFGGRRFHPPDAYRVVELSLREQFFQQARRGFHA